MFEKNKTVGQTQCRKEGTVELAFVDGVQVTDPEKLAKFTFINARMELYKKQWDNLHNASKNK